VTTAVSPAARRLVRRYVAVDPEIVPNGVDVDEIQAAQPDPWARSLSDDVVVFIGRAEPRKDFGTVARAFADVATTRTNAHLVATVDALPDGVVCERIHCIGRVDSDRRDALLRAADICVVPSLGGESFGVVVAEGLAAGAAVVSSDIPGYRFAGGDAALYVKPGDVPAWRDAMARLLDDRNERARLAAAGPGRARGFDWSRVAEATVAVYERAIA
jgi:phosphatidylinositol alpha-mannosyltransferase